MYMDTSSSWIPYLHAYSLTIGSHRTTVIDSCEPGIELREKQPQSLSHHSSPDLFSSHSLVAMLILAFS